MWTFRPACWPTSSTLSQVSNACVVSKECRKLHALLSCASGGTLTRRASSSAKQPALFRNDAKSVDGSSVAQGEEDSDDDDADADVDAGSTCACWSTSFARGRWRQEKGQAGWCSSPCSKGPAECVSISFFLCERDVHRSGGHSSIRAAKDAAPASVQSTARPAQGAPPPPPPPPPPPLFSQTQQSAHK